MITDFSTTSSAQLKRRSNGRMSVIYINPIICESTCTISSYYWEILGS